MAESKRFDVVGLGQCSFDILGRLAEFPGPDQKTELDELKCQGGGPVATALVALARLGVSTAFTGRIGDDDFGFRIRDELINENVDCRNLLIDPGKSSQTAFIAVNRQGQRNIFWTRGSAGPLRVDDLDKELITQARVLHLDGLQHDASMAAAQLAREHGVVTVLDGGTMREGTKELLPLIDHLVVSAHFGEQLSPGDTFQNKLSALAAFGAETVSITYGEAGSWSQQRGDSAFYQPSFPVAAIDTTGCGDVFHGGYIYGLLQGWSLPVMVKFAAACAALKTRQLGGRTAIPDLTEINHFLSVINKQ